MTVSVIGGAGHVGLAMGLLLSDAGHEVTLIDEDESALRMIESGELPYKEPMGEELLQAGLETDRLETATNVDSVAQSETIVIVVGTPIDEHNNPQMDNLLNLIEELIPNLRHDQLLILRSTLYPGTTEIIKKKLEKADLSVGSDLYLAFAPERVAQHRAIEEMVELPQLVGTFDDESYRQSKQFFDTYLKSDCPHLTPIEAEIGKLFTNMWRYIMFATVNEFYLITESFATHSDANVHRILDKTSQNYPRFDVPSPGANVGGPCLTKDGWFLVDNIPYNELVSTAFQINEGMPAQIIQNMSQKNPNPEKIALLGMTFKRDSDDTRNSVSFKMKKQLRMKGYEDIVLIEPNRPEFDRWEEAEGCDWVILMTPHTEFEDLNHVLHKVNNSDCLFADIWGHWDEMKHRSENGYFYGRDAEEILLRDTSTRGV